MSHQGWKPGGFGRINVFDVLIISVIIKAKE
jgi:hypothetical protein